MSVYGLELALYDITTKSLVRKQFIATPDVAVAGYALEADEQAMLKDLDVGRLLDVGVSPMLTLGLWMCLRGPQTLLDYLEAVAGHAQGRS
ncbi:hypothetical protein [Phenylobacterium sp. J367]|uniref:hypothetical protein n=1 Tax=Phenylobacterium sp. J367 TaxID=2898435 RepID=UPI0021507588|nr:hypothetical protein [Phenylobacterium sp. J367]MCR5879621.1 hypothetical protein [Phenylobacterium sp. J367]